MEPIETYNIFETLGLPDAENLNRRVILGHVIRSEIERLGLSQREAAAIMDTNPSNVAAIVENNYDDLSLEQLIVFCESLGLTVSLEFRRATEAASTR